MRKLIMYLAVASLSATLRADQGTTAATFLKLDTSPRAIAMGDAFGGIADDVTAIEYNPAGTAYLNQKEFTIMHSLWFQDIYYDYAALAWPMKNIGTFGLDFFYLNAGSFDGYTFNAQNQPVSTGTFTAGDMYGTLSYSRKILDYLSAAMTVKFMDESIATYSDGGVAVTIAGFYKTPLPGMNVGLTIANLGPSEGFQQAFSLPITTRLGLGYQPQDNIKVGLDYLQPIETAGKLSIGGEYGYRNTLYVRMGYAYQGGVDYNETYTGYGPAVAVGLSMGVGLKLYKNYLLDYAYQPYGFLGTAHHFSLSVNFN